ncbi:MAG: replicative DNA helicase [Nannocystaceae bacterium]
MTEYPQNIEAERALLGGILQDPGQLLSVDIDSDHFYRPDHRQLLRHLQAMRSEGHAIDAATLPGLLVARGWEPSHLGYVIELPDYCPSTTNLEHYANAVRVAWRARSIREAAESAIELANNMDADGALETIRLGTGKIQGGGIKLSTIAQMADLTEIDIGARCDAAAEGKEPGLLTGFSCFDERGGFEPGDLVIVAARPSVGKTALALALLGHALGDPGCEQRYTPFVYSGEMGLPSLGHRMLADKANVNLSRIRRGHAGDYEWRSIVDVTAHWRTRVGYACDVPGLSPTQIVGLIHRAASMGPLHVALIDYLTLLKIRPERGQSRADAVGNATKLFKQTAQDLGIAVVLLAQLNRGGADGPPKLHHLKESGEIEQDADVIALLSKPHVWAPMDHPSHRVMLDIAKWRNAWTGVEYMRFDGAHQRFEQEDANAGD